MAPLSQAVNSTFVRTDADGAGVYGGEVDGDWTVVAVPNGGYVLALILSSAIHHQSPTAHKDPIHVTAHFLRAASVAPFEVRVKTVRRGKSFTNLQAEFVQGGSVRVTSHLIFGVLSSSPSTANAYYSGPLTISPPSPHARRHPLHTHPSHTPPTPLRRGWNYTAHVAMAEDPLIAARNLSENLTDGGTVGGGGVEWGAWFELRGDQGERVTTPGLAFLVDQFVNFPETLYIENSKAIQRSWFPTLVLSLEFKFPLPPVTSPDHSPNIVGIYSSGRFMIDPHGRHDAYVEVWSAPPRGAVQEGWREKQVCLAVAHQMALVVPGDMNLRNSSGETKWAKL